MPLPPGDPSGCARLLALAAVGLAMALPAGARDWGKSLFEWTDERGVVRYTSYPERVPADRRDSLREMQHRIGEPDASPVALGSFDSGGVAEASGNAPSQAGGASQGSPDAVASAAAGSPLRADLSALDREIATLQAKIARDQEILKTLISDPEAAPELSTSVDLATIAGRLPQQQAELRELLAQRELERSGEVTP
jgi:hypothetical protein